MLAKHKLTNDTVMILKHFPESNKPDRENAKLVNDAHIIIPNDNYYCRIIDPAGAFDTQMFYGIELEKV